MQRPQLGPDAAPAPGKKHYIAIGDSFVSGEGAPAEILDTGGDARELYYEGTSDPGNKCHRSPEAYPAQVWRELGKQEWSFDFRACSGAKADNLAEAQTTWFHLPTSDTGAGSGNPPQWSTKDVTSPEQVPTARPVDLVTFKMGGNDLEFSDIVKGCLLAAANGHPAVKCSGKWDSIIDLRRKKLREMLRKTFDSIELELNDGGQLIVSGYPRPFRDDPPSACGLGVGLGMINRADMLWLNTVADRLNDDLRDAAVAAGAAYVDVTHLLTASGNSTLSVYHDMCVDSNDQRWINRLIPTHLERTAHPRAASHRAEAGLILACYRDPANGCAELTPDGSFQAANDGYTYTLGNGELVIRQNGQVITVQPKLGGTELVLPATG